MNRKQMLMSFVCALALLAQGSPLVWAQDKTAKRVEPGVVFVQTDNGGNATFNFHVAEPQDRLIQTGTAANTIWFSSGGQGDPAFQFFSTEMGFDIRLVKGAPFSATTVSETIQTLADGNRIVQRSEGRIYRDSQSRTRHERSVHLGGSNVEHQTITILDPNSGLDYVLDPTTRTARRTMPRIAPPPPPAAPPPAFNRMPADAANATQEMPKQIRVSGGVLQGSALRKVQPPYPPIAKAAQAEGAVQVQVLVNETGEVLEASAVNGHPLLRDAALQAAQQWQFKPTELGGKPVKVSGVLTFNFTLGASGAPAAPAEPGTRVNINMGSTNTEELGKQVIEGVECTGKRTTTTIPAGVIGNERPLETVRESWYSDELKMVIMSKHTDPRFGESTYRATNISRSEPDAALFQLPADYTVKEGGQGFGIARPAIELMEMERKVRKPNNQ